MERNKNRGNEKYNAPFAMALSSLMKSRKVTQEALANNIGMKRQTVSQYVNGISEPSYEVLVKIARYFGVSTDYLLGISEAATNEPQIKEICDATGLSSSGVKCLIEQNSLGYELPCFVNDCINLAIGESADSESSILNNYYRLMRESSLKDKVNVKDDEALNTEHNYRYVYDLKERGDAFDYAVTLAPIEAIEFYASNIAKKIEHYLLEAYRDGKYSQDKR